MLKKIFLVLSVATLPLMATEAEADMPAQENDQIARVNWNINIGFGGCGGCPYYYPYCYYPYAPPCAYPYPYLCYPPCGGYWW